MGLQLQQVTLHTDNLGLLGLDLQEVEFGETA